MPQKVLAEDWSDYDDRKKKHTDANFFACTEAWEVDYLVRKILKTHPYNTETKVRAAITSCCREVGSPHPRTAFVRCVMSKL